MLPTERMPTAGKLVAALGFAGLAWQATRIVKEIWPVEQDFGQFSPFAALVGLWAGWFVVGRRLGRGYASAISAGLTGLFALVFWNFLLLSFYEMIGRSLDLRYKGVVDAVTGIFEIAADYAANVYYWPLIGFLVIGAAVVGVMAEFAARRLF